jgi:hypothetical protein
VVRVQKNAQLVDMNGKEKLKMRLRRKLELQNNTSLAFSVFQNEFSVKKNPF